VGDNSRRYSVAVLWVPIMRARRKVPALRGGRLVPVRTRRASIGKVSLYRNYYNRCEVGDNRPPVAGAGSGRSPGKGIMPEGPKRPEKCGDKFPALSLWGAEGCFLFNFLAKDHDHLVHVARRRISSPLSGTACSVGSEPTDLCRVKSPGEPW